MPVFFHELPRPAYRKRSRLARPELALISLAVLSAVTALWFVRPQPASTPPRRAAAIKLVPLPPSSEGLTSTTTAEQVRPPLADASPIGSIRPMPARPQPLPPPQGAFRDIERVAPQNYIGFREVGTGR